MSTRTISTVKRRQRQPYPVNTYTADIFSYRVRSPSFIFHSRSHSFSHSQPLLPLLLGTAIFSQIGGTPGHWPKHAQVQHVLTNTPPPVPSCALIPTTLMSPEMHDNTYITGEDVRCTGEASMYQGSKAFSLHPSLQLRQRARVLRLRIPPISVIPHYWHTTRRCGLGPSTGCIGEPGPLP